MKIRSLIFCLAALAGLLAGAGCSHLDVGPPANPDRVLHGTINYNTAMTPPPDTVVTIKIIDASAVEQKKALASQDVPVGNRPTVELPPQILAETRITSPSAPPIAFELPYHATDDLLRHGINVDVTVMWNNRVQLRTISAFLVTDTTANHRQEIWVEPVR